MKSTLLYIGFYVICIVVIILSVVLDFVGETTQTHTIQSTDKVEATEGNSNGFRTRVYYIVTTDKGIYHIRTSWINAAPQCAGIKCDSTYILTTRGVSIPLLGMYPCIIDAKK